ncbi:MAG: 6-bladed beta-propeller [Marinifilaceae bacterium]
MLQKCSQLLKRSILILVVVSAGFALTNCNQSIEDTSIKTIQLADLNEKQSIDATQMVKHIQLIPLEFNEDCAIESLDQIDLYRDTIFILSNDQLFLFNKKGKFISKFASVGKGPGEYLSAFNFSIDRKAKQICIYDYMQDKIQVYDIKGKFIKKIPIGKSWQTIDNGNGNYVSYPLNILGNQPHSIVVVNTQGDTLKTFNNFLKFKLTGNPFLIHHVGALYKKKNQIAFHQYLSDTLFYVNTEKLELIPHYILKGFNTLPLRFLGDIEAFEKSSDNYSWLNRIQESANYLYLTFKNEGSRKNILYSKQDDKLLLVPKLDSTITTNNLTPYFWPDQITENDQVINGWTAVSFLEKFKRIKAEEANVNFLKEHGIENFSALYQSIQKNDNPIIQITTLN